MKLVAALIISILSCLSISAQAVTEYFNVGNPIEYCGTEFTLAWSAHPQANYYIQEYLPEGESFENYKQMFTVSVFFTNQTPQEAVQAKISELEQRKKTDPVVNYKLAKNDSEFILEFIVSDARGEKINIVEEDLHHYKQMTIEGRKASVLCFYSCRAYGDDIAPFIQSIPEKRGDWYLGLINLNLIPVFPKK